MEPVVERMATSLAIMRRPATWTEMGEAWGAEGRKPPRESAPSAPALETEGADQENFVLITEGPIGSEHFIKVEGYIGQYTPAMLRDLLGKPFAVLPPEVRKVLWVTIYCLGLIVLLFTVVLPEIFTAAIRDS